MNTGSRAREWRDSRAKEVDDVGLVEREALLIKLAVVEAIDE
jgi:hypothetical protein